MATAVVAACGTMQTNAKGDGPNDRGIVGSRDAQILAGWTAAFRKWVHDAHTPNWLSPGWLATFVQPQPGVTVVALWLFQGTKTVIVGDNSVVRSKIENASGRKATIVVCTTGNFSEVEGSSDGVSPERAAKPRFAQCPATMVDTSAGWKVENQTMGNSCPGG